MADVTNSARVLSQITLARALAREAMLRSGDCFFDAVTRPQALANNGWANAVCGARGGPIRVVDASNCDRPYVPFVLSRLFYGGRPAAVARLIISFGVKAVNRVLKRGAHAHISQKRGERFIPALAHANATPAPLGEVLEMHVLTPSLHAYPNAVSWAALAAYFVAMLQSAVRVSHSHLNSVRPPKSKLHLATVKRWLA